MKNNVFLLFVRYDSMVRTLQIIAILMGIFSFRCRADDLMLAKQSKLITETLSTSATIAETKDRDRVLNPWPNVFGGADLIRNYSWQEFEGAHVADGKLCVDSIDRWIISNDGDQTSDWLPGHPHGPDTPNPPIHLTGPHIETMGSFAVTAKLETTKLSGGLINLYGRLPTIQDEARREGEAIAFGIQNDKAIVKVWDGKSATPKIYEFAQNLGKEINLSLVKEGNVFRLELNGDVIGRLADPGVFKSGVAYLGLDVAKENRLCLQDFSVMAPQLELDKTKIATADPFQEIRLDQNGLRVFAAGIINIGTAVSTNPLLTDADYRNRLAQNFNMVTPENAMKFQFVHPSKDHYAFEEADAIVKFAELNHMKVHAHTLVWGEANPRWVTEGHYSNAELRQILHDHIMEVVGHFKGKVTEWDVLNEPLEDDGSLRQTMWAKAIGSDYPAIVFKWAHEADPGVKLFINEYGADGLTTEDGASNLRAKGLAELVAQIRASGAPVDGVGLQMHDALNDSTNKKSISANMKRFQEMGVETRISEIDVNMDTPNRENEMKQAAIYRSALRACLANPENCHTYSMWGFEDRFSSLQKNEQMYSPSEGLGFGMIFDRKGNPKPAFRALQEELAK